MNGSTKRFVFGGDLFIHFVLTCRLKAFCFGQRTFMAQGLVNGVLNNTLTHSCFQFEWFPVGSIARKTEVQSLIELYQRHKMWY